MARARKFDEFDSNECSLICLCESECQCLNSTFSAPKQKSVEDVERKIDIFQLMVRHLKNHQVCGLFMIIYVKLAEKPVHRATRFEHIKDIIVKKKKQETHRPPKENQRSLRDVDFFA